MKVLGIDTSSNVASAAVIDDDKIIAEFTLNLNKTHSQLLMPMIDNMLSACECDIKDIDLFAVAVGPGSFTGLRIGIATAKGLAHACGKKIVPVGTLEALAYNLPYAEHIIVPIMDARREEVYTGGYIWDEDGFREIEEPHAAPLAECLDGCGELLDVIFVGDGVPVYKEKIVQRLGERALFVPAGCSLQRGASVAALGLKNKEKALECEKICPVYIRKSQAEREYEEREKKESKENADS